MTAPSAAPTNMATTAATLLANLGLLPFASEESAPMPVIVSVRTAVVRSGKLISLHRDARGGYSTAHRDRFRKNPSMAIFQSPGLRGLDSRQ
jgi:hypothetical protein